MDERVTLVGYTSDPNAAEHAVQFDENGKVIRGYRGPGWHSSDDARGEIVKGLSDEAVRILKKPGTISSPHMQPPDTTQRQHFYIAPIELDTVRKELEYIYSVAGGSYRSLAIVFAHSYTYPEHELIIGSLASEIGFTQISMSSQLLPMIKMVPRGVSCTADAYLTPVLRKYLDAFFGGFDEALRGGGQGKEGSKRARVEFMASDGGLLDLDNFSGLRSLLSGPAGGVVGYALTSWDAKRKIPIIG